MSDYSKHCSMSTRQTMQRCCLSSSSPFSFYFYFIFSFFSFFSFFPFFSFLGFSSGLLRLQSPIYMVCGFRHDAEGT